MPHTLAVAGFLSAAGFSDAVFFASLIVPDEPVFRMLNSSSVYRHRENEPPSQMRGACDHEIGLVRNQQWTRRNKQIQKIELITVIEICRRTQGLGY